MPIIEKETIDYSPQLFEPIPLEEETKVLSPVRSIGGWFIESVGGLKYYYGNSYIKIQASPQTKIEISDGTGAKLQLDATNYFQAYDTSYLRVKLDTEKLSFYSAIYDGAKVGEIYGGAGLYVEAPSPYNIHLRISGTEVFTVADGGSVSQTINPYGDNTYNLGSSTKRWKEIHVVTLYQGDAVFANGFRITEGEKSLIIKNSQGKKVLEITEDGQLITYAN